MKTIVKRAIRQEKGNVLILVLVLLVLGGLILAPLLGLMSTGLAAGQVYEERTSQLYAADAGVEDTINWLLHGKPVDWGWTWDGAEQVWRRDVPLHVNDNDVNVTVEPLPEEDTYQITSTATDGDRSTTVISVVRAIAEFEGCYLTEGLTLGTQETMEGDIIVVGDVTLEQSSGIEGDMYVDGDLVLEQHSSIEADVICVAGDITLENNTEINSDIHFLGEDCTITIAKPDAFIKGNIRAEGNLTIVIDFGNAAHTEITGDIYAPRGDVHVHLNKPNSELEGDIYAGGSINVNVTGNAEHTGTEYPVYTGGAPFEIADCPSIPSTPVIIHTYVVS